MTLRSVPCRLLRGGTSRGPFFLASDLPANPAARDAALIAIMGSGHPLEIDGIGGGNPLTSKVAIVSPSPPGSDTDVDYLFTQVAVTEWLVDTRPNCGNMLAGVAPFAIEAGLVAATAPETVVRILNVNTGKRIEAVVQTPDGRVCYHGDTAIAGVPGTAAPVRLAFLDAAGSKTAGLLPTGTAQEMIDGVPASCVDMAMPMVFFPAAAFGKSGAESPAELDGDRAFMARLEALRREAGARMGLGDVSRSVIPKPGLLAAPSAGGTILARYFMPWSCHTAYATTGGICTAAACLTLGSVAHELAAASNGTVTIEHPSGTMPIAVELDATGKVKRASLLRTARLLFEGRVFYEENEGLAASPTPEGQPPDTFASSRS